MAARGSASTTEPKQLRRRLGKTEAELKNAEAKRDEAQARVEALAIFADEIRGVCSQARTTNHLAAASAWLLEPSWSRVPSSLRARDSTFERGVDAWIGQPFLVSLPRAHRAASATVAC